MMKRILSLMCAAAMLLSLVACAANPAPEVAVAETVPAETTAAAPAPAPRADALIEVLEEEVQRMAELGAVDMYFSGKEARSADFSVMPDSYDLRELGFVNPVRSQGNWGTCWGFAASSASEISVLSEMGITSADFTENYGQELDLSEKHLAWFANGALPRVEDYPEGEYPYPELISQAGEGTYNIEEEAEGPNSRFGIGGLLAYATGMYAAGIGPAMESQYPYLANDGTDSTAAEWSLPEEARFAVALELENSYILPSPAIRDENDNYVYNEYGTYAIKRELLNGRAVSIAYYADQAMDPNALWNMRMDYCKAAGVPGTDEDFATYLNFIFYNKLTANDLTPEQLKFCFILAVVTQAGLPVEDATAMAEGRTTEELRNAFQPQEQQEAPAEETEAETETEVEEEPEDLYAIAEALGLDYDKLQKELQLQEEASADVYMNTETYAQYVNTTALGISHGVTIVGWDDNYSAENFLADKRPPADGAWIVRNSWGKDYGNDGYFYLSYYDQSICLPESFDFVTSYKAGVPGTVSILGMDFMTSGSYPAIHTEDAISYANIFTMDPGVNVLRYISVLCGDLDTEVTADVYLLNEGAAVPTDGILLDRVVKDLRYGGYYRIPLSHDFAVPDGSRIGVVVTQRVGTGENAKFAVPYAITTNEQYLENYNKLVPKAKQSTTYGVGCIGQGESWVCQNGQWYDWADVVEDLKASCDMAQYFSYDNLGIKAYAYSMAELDEIHNFDESVSYHGATMDVCSDCSYSVVKP